MSQEMSQIQVPANDFIVKYHSWNANGIDETKIVHMMPFWEGADLVFIQETKLNPTEEPAIRALAKRKGFDSIFHQPHVAQYSTYQCYGLCVFFKTGLQVNHIDLEKNFTDIPKKDPFRIMLISIKSELFGNNAIYFLNVYFPSNHSNDHVRDEERLKWVATIQQFSEKLKDKYAVLVGDFNMMQHNTCLSPKMHPNDGRCVIFEKCKKIFMKLGFMDVCGKLWPDNVFTRFQGISKSRLDYIIVSQKMHELHHMVEPMYNENVMNLSDHINLKCEIRYISTHLQSLVKSPKIAVILPDLEDIIKLEKLRVCPYCDYMTKKYSVMEKHIRVHTKEKPFRCPKNCGFRCTQDTWMARHAVLCRGHFSTRMQKCPDCPAETPDVGQFEAHRAMCAKKKAKFDPSARFPCPKCLYSTNRTDLWALHLKTRLHTEGMILKWYFCFPCNFLTLHSNQLQNHLTLPVHLEMIKSQSNEQDADN